AVAVDLGDGDAREVAQHVEELHRRARAVPVARRRGAVLAEEVEVQARAVGGPVAARDDRAQALVGPDDLQRRHELLDELRVQRVAPLRPVESQAGGSRLAEPLQDHRRPFADYGPLPWHSVLLASELRASWDSPLNGR